MSADVKSFVRKCPSCQFFSPIPRQPAQELSAITAPWPFAQWGIDLVGPFPKASRGRRFLIVAIDYFTKWAEAEPLSTISSSATKNFLWKSIVCRFGVPQSVISDNGTQFRGGQFKELCEELGIKQKFSTPAHPQSNGQVERTNRSILDILKKKLEEKKGVWADAIPEVLWAYRTSTHSATSATPFSLAFGTEAVIPIEIGLPSPRVTFYDGKRNDEQLQVNLDLLEIHRLKASTRQEAYKRAMSKHYNKNVRFRKFNVGDLVLKRRFETQSAAGIGKFAPNWEGPYIINKEVRDGAYQLKDMSGRLLQNAWNVHNLRRYFQ